jgi:hypothetical protein
MRCPHCKNKLLQKSGTSTRLRIRGTVEFSDEGVCKSQCYWCHQAVEIPIGLKKGAEDEETFTLTLPPDKGA